MKGNIIRLNTLHLNSASMNGVREVQGSSASGGGGIVPIPPVEPTPTYILSASVANGVVTATRNGVVVSLPYTANEGDTIVLSVQPNEGYEFNGWADGNTDNPRTITMNADVALSAQCVEVVVPPSKEYIQFEDAAVEAICVANWSSDGIGLTEEDAAKVTDIGIIFRGNKEITSFEEFRYFTGVQKIGHKENDTYGAFKGCSNLRSIALPDSCYSIGYGAFGDCTSLTSITYGNVTEIGSRAFRNCTSMGGELSFPYLTTLKGDGFFAGTKITSFSAPLLLSIPGHSSLGDYGAFANCSALANIDIPSAENIGPHTFYKCTSLGVVELLVVTGIGNAAFHSCTNLQSVLVRTSTPPTLGSNVFYGSTCPIYVPDASLEAYKTATNWNTYADRIHPLSEIEGSLVFYDKLVGDGVAYINTEYYPTSWDNVEWDADAPSVYNKYIFGSKSSVYSIANLVYSATQTYYNFKISGSTLINEDNTKRQRRTLRIVDLGNGSYRREVADLDSGVANAIDTGWSGKDVVATNALRVFCSTTTAGANEKFYKGAIRSIIITDAKTGNTIMSLRPCIFAGEAGMWDEVGNKFYGNAATSGEFSVAND